MKNKRCVQAALFPHEEVEKKEVYYEQIETGLFGDKKSINPTVSL
ncbi:hypothetical protein [Bacteroides sp. 519]|nr:hypothetical protein [Bacteroides sp. 519]